MDDFILVSTSELGEAIELDLEDTGELPLDTLQSQFGPSAYGLQYRSLKTGNFRGVSVKDGKLQSPAGGWSDRLYIVNCGTVAGTACERSNQGTSEHGSIHQCAPREGIMYNEIIMILMLSFKLHVFL